jgi:DNA repair protein RadC
MKKELLEEILSYVFENPSQAAESLCSEYGSFLQITEATDGCLAESLDGKSNLALYLKLCATLAARRISDGFSFGKKHSEDEIREYLSALLFGMPEETVYMISIDTSGRCVAADRVGEGIVNYSGVLPHKVVDTAKRRGAKSVVVAHNHPGACLVPSQNDISATEILSYILREAGIVLERSYIVSGMKCTEIKK